MSQSVVLLLFFLAGCNALAQINIAGEWRITATSSIFGITATATGRIEQTGSSISGQLSISGTPCASSAPFTGTISGTSLTVNVDENGQVVTFTGAVTMDGNLASGNYTAPSGGCTNGDRGTWFGRRLPVMNNGGVVHGASFGAQPPPAGSIGSLFGMYLSSVTQVAASLPLPTSLGAVSVQINGVAVPCGQRLLVGLAESESIATRHAMITMLS